MLRARALLDHPESCTTLLSQIRKRHATPVLDVPIHGLLGASGPAYDHAIEVHGLAGSGKTHLLYLLTIEAVLAGKAVLVFDADMKWDNARLLQLLAARVSDGEEGAVIAGSDDVTYLLDQVYLYQPQSASAFLEDAEGVLDFCRREMRDRSVRYILVDSLSAFHWQSLTDAGTTTLDIYKVLQKTAEQISALLIYTTWDIGFNYIAMPNSTRLVAQRKLVLQFTQGLEQAMETRSAREEVLDRGIFYLKNEINGKRFAFFVRAGTCGVIQG